MDKMFSHPRRMAVSLAVALLIASAGSLRSFAEPPVEPEYLDQGWSRIERQWIYSFSQGSELIPYDWFRALEMADSAALFRSDGLARFGYLPRQPGAGNADGLPVGFAVDMARSGNWLGMNCTACHTNQIEYTDPQSRKVRLLQIDGAPGNGDLYAFLDGLNKSMQATLGDPAKLDRFTKRVLATNPGQTPAQLTAALKSFAADFATFVHDSTATTVPGPGRTDAFGMIFNRVVSIDLGIPENTRTPDAPVSFPFLWTTNVQDFTQWSGGVPNLHNFERLGRNVGQVLGVFGKMPNLGSNFTLRRYASSVHIPELLRVDRDLGELKSPTWPGAIDGERQARGKILYDKFCVECHVDARGATGPIKTNIMRASEVGTDPLTADNAVTRKSKTGPLRNGIGNLVYQPEEVTAEILSKIVPRTIIDPSAWRPAQSPDPSYQRLVEAARVSHAELQKELRLIVRKLGDGGLQMYLAANPNKGFGTYKGGPLNGVWATAPYLHNGSVPTLADLLKAPAERPKTFTVGSRKLDDQRIGFASGPGDGGFAFDATLPGNGNGGHDYGTTMQAEERLDLIEYLKGL